MKVQGTAGHIMIYTKNVLGSVKPTYIDNRVSRTQATIDLSSN